MVVAHGLMQVVACSAAAASMHACMCARWVQVEALAASVRQLLQPHCEEPSHADANADAERVVHAPSQAPLSAGLEDPVCVGVHARPSFHYVAIALAALAAG